MRRIVQSLFDNATLRGGHLDLGIVRAELSSARVAPTSGQKHGALAFEGMASGITLERVVMAALAGCPGFESASAKDLAAAQLGTGAKKSLRHLAVIHDDCRGATGNDTCSSLVELEKIVAC